MKVSDLSYNSVSYWVWFQFCTCRYLVFLAPFLWRYLFFFKPMYIFDAFAKDEVPIAVLVYCRFSVFIIIVFLILGIKHLTKTIQEQESIGPCVVSGASL